MGLQHQGHTSNTIDHVDDGLSRPCADEGLTATILLSRNPQRRQINLTTGDYRIGSDAACEIHLACESVAPQHALLKVNHDRVTVIDQASPGGCWINGVRVTSAEILSDFRLQCGEASVEVHHQRNLQASTLITSAQSPATDSASPEDGVPKILGYSPLTLIGQGKFGKVFQTTQLGTNRPSAIKVLSEEYLGNDRVRQTFYREASIVTQLKHPQIVECYGFGLVDSLPYLVMEYFPSEDLISIVDRQPETRRIRVAVRIVTRVLEALEFAHGQGIVHRDIKPANILASTASGKLKCKVADFGLAKFYQSAGYSGITDSNDICGTLQYMSPEQLADSRSASPACDVYSAVVVLYRLVAGTLPFLSDGTTVEIIDRRIHESPMPVKQANPNVPDELAWLIDLGLSPQPQLRFSTAASLLEKLQKLPLIT